MGLRGYNQFAFRDIEHLGTYLIALPGSKLAVIRAESGKLNR